LIACTPHHTSLLHHLHHRSHGFAVLHHFTIMDCIISGLAIVPCMIFVIMLSSSSSAFRYHPSYCPSFFFLHVHGVWITMHVYHEFYKLRITDNGIKTSILDFFSRIATVCFFGCNCLMLNQPTEKN
jgi:hypothetical protein